MSAPDNDKYGENVQFDRLCELCTELFDSEATWDPGRYHQDIRALQVSADAGCHLCNLIFGQIDSSNLEEMRKDLDEGFTASCRQLRIFLFFDKLYVDAWKRCSSAQSVDFDQTWSTDGQRWSRVATLNVNEYSDHIDQERSTSYMNCSNATLLQISLWMGECLTSHTKCFEMQTIAATRNILPRRLLDLALHAEFVKLEPSEPLPLHTVYVTLSHSWGGQCKTTVTASNLATLQAGIRLSTLPKTFRDAVLLTRSLGFRYLWIDALCIIQDSNQEWSHEASLMGDIYANSFLTISATNSPDSEGGLYHSRNPLSVWPCRIKTTWGCFPVNKLVLKVPGWERERAMEPLRSRGWAFQERLLSKRTIHLSRDQVRWECHCLAASEVYPSGLDDDDIGIHGVPTKNVISLLKDENSSPQVLWERIREEYSEKHLTVATDKLAAFSGVARMVHKVLKRPKEDYIAGLWRPELFTELLWKKFSENHIKVTKGTHSSQYIAPSWSWASFDGPIWDLNRAYDVWDHPCVYVNILEAKTFPHSDEYGSVSGGFLTVRGSLSYVELTSYPYDSKYRKTRDWKVCVTQGLTLTHKWSHASLDNISYTLSSPSTKHSFYFMPMLSRSWNPGHNNCSLIGLLLERTADSVHQYRRSGVLELEGLDKEALLLPSSGLVPLDSDASKDVDIPGTHIFEIV